MDFIINKEEESKEQPTWIPTFDQGLCLLVCLYSSLQLPNVKTKAKKDQENKYYLLEMINNKLTTD